MNKQMRLKVNRDLRKQLRDGLKRQKQRMVRSLEVMKPSVKRETKGGDCQDKMDISSE